AVEVIADRADAQRIVAGLELGGREAVVPLRVADDRDRERCAVPPRGNEHAFHRAFLGRRHGAGERGLRAALTGRDDGRERGGCEQGQSGLAHQIPPLRNPGSRRSRYWRNHKTSYGLPPGTGGRSTSSTPRNGRLNAAIAAPASPAIAAIIRKNWVLSIW